jgi:hypothetical protein
MIIFDINEYRQHQQVPQAVAKRQQSDAAPNKFEMLTTTTS